MPTLKMIFNALIDTLASSVLGVAIILLVAFWFVHKISFFFGEFHFKRHGSYKLLKKMSCEIDGMSHDMAHVREKTNLIYQCVVRRSMVKSGETASGETARQQKKNER